MKNCNQKFFLCEHCGNLIGLINASGVPIECCGEPMLELEANTVDAAAEKHLPKVEINGGNVKVKVGEVAHPMTEEHYISWMYLQTDRGGQRKCLEPGNAPELEFELTDDTPAALFSYCNLHGLWMTEL